MIKKQIKVRGGNSFFFFFLRIFYGCFMELPNTSVNCPYKNMFSFNLVKLCFHRLLNDSYTMLILEHKLVFLSPLDSIGFGR